MPARFRFSSPEFLAPITQANLVCVTVLNILKYAEKTDVSPSDVRILSNVQEGWKANAVWNIVMLFRAV